MVTILVTLFAVVLAAQAAGMVIDFLRHKGDDGGGSWGGGLGIGFVTNFFDTLGIGSFAPTTLLFDVTKQLKNPRHLPGTLNVGHAIPVLTQAILFTTTVAVQPLTLVALIGSATVGSYIGSNFVTKLPAKKVQLYMGVALIATAILMALRQLGMIDILGADNTATGLSGIRLIIGVVGNFIFGALMTVGCGLYAPCMAMVYMLGMSPLVAFPIMMGSCAGLMPAASINFIRTGDYARKLSLGLGIGGVVGVFIAFTFVKSLNLDILVFLIVLVVLYTGATYIKKGLSKEPEQKTA